MTDQSDEREALARHYDPKAFEDHPVEKRSPLAAIQWGARRKLAQEAADRVLDSGWLAEHDKRVKAEADAKVRKHVESMSSDPEHPIEAWHRESLLAILDRREGF